MIELCTATSCIADGEMCQHYFTCGQMKRYTVSLQIDEWPLPEEQKPGISLWLVLIALAVGYFLGHFGGAWQRGSLPIPWLF